MSETVISLEDVSMRLRLHRLRGAEATQSAGKKMQGQAVGCRIEHDRWGGYVVALENVTLDIKDGERVAVIGHNGAGKTSFLRLLAGIYTPSKGRCIVRGRRSCVLSPGLGMSGESTLIESIKFALALYGKPLDEIDAKVPEILEFAGLEEFAHVPLSACSRGMKARLGFSVATSTSPDVFLVDEAIGAGDVHFARRAQKRIKQLFEDSRVLVLSAHSGSILRRFCSKALWLERGQVRAFGPLDDIWEEYFQRSGAMGDDDDDAVSPVDDLTDI